MPKRIIITGGSGAVGQHIITYLLAQGHTILNLDLTLAAAFSPYSPSLKVHTIKTDLTSSGDVYNALTAHFTLTEPLPAEPCSIPDAVIHLAGHARNMLVADNKTFQDNVTAAYNIIDAACKLGVKKIILASSICVYGVTYAFGNADFASFPVDETTPVAPMDPYALSKRCTEIVAEGFARRFGVDIYVLRIGRVVLPDEYNSLFSSYVHQPERWKVHGWSYVDVRDLGRMCERSVEVDGLGFQVFNAVNNEITCWRKAEELLAELCPGVMVTGKLGDRDAPISNAKIKELLRFQEEHCWRDYYVPEK
ncbi:NAD(P)-binding protein [Aspergillus granulosus]|uniref:NAD(P)-binding protein n=1 Tax=Aspergillus granulosus TaxID=176169 RepID=A0ABR4H8L0_9EURO